MENKEVIKNDYHTEKNRLEKCYYPKKKENKDKKMPPNGKKKYKIIIRKTEKKTREWEGIENRERGGESETELGKYRTGERKRERKRWGN